MKANPLECPNVGDPEELTCVEWFAGGVGNHQGLSRVIPNLRCVAFCEREGYAVANLVEKMEVGWLAPAPIWTDCRTFPIEPFLDRRLDLFIASYPCQGESVAGNQLGTEDPRFLWPYCRDFVAAARPVLCFFENVRGHVNTSMVEVLRDLAELQYAVEPGIFSAEECGGSHSRERVFILARDTLADTGRLRDAGRGITGNLAGAARRAEGEEHERQRVRDSLSHSRETVADTNDARCKGRGKLGEPAAGWTSETGIGHDLGRRDARILSTPPGPNDAEGWYRVLFSAPWLAPSLRRSEAERIFRRVADGLAHESYLHELRGLFCENRVDRLRMLGNGVYPDSAAIAFVTLAGKMAGVLS